MNCFNVRSQWEQLQHFHSPTLSESGMHYSVLIAQLCLFVAVSCEVMTGPSSRLIVNGSFADSRDFPYAMRLLSLPSYYAMMPAYRCSGTMLSRRWVLTAAHCMYKRPSGPFEKVATKIRAGIRDVGQKGQVTDAEMFECHPNYNPDIGGWRNDICLVKTSEYLELDETVQPVKLPHEDVRPHQKVNVTGFGEFMETHEETSAAKSFHLRTITMSIGSASECKHIDEYNDTMDICLIPPYPGSGICQGDSGAGAVVRQTDGSFLIFGVVTAGFRCGFTSLGPRVFANIDWINNVMNVKHG